jgi:FAD/FMN-containing dehydrogenase
MRVGSTLFFLIGCEPVSVPEYSVHDVTELVDIEVERVASPVTTRDVQALVSEHDGPVSIGGGRFSMGGQIATEEALFIDMRSMDDVLQYDPAEREITVEAGITWRQIQEHVDADDLSVQIMQSYANFTVGGSLSVNAHGRYVNRGPVVHSVASIRIVLADGSLVHASRSDNPVIFFGAIGGYGGLGVITEVTLHLDPNQRVRRSHERMAASAYPEWFERNIQKTEGAVFHNADLYPPKYDRGIAITYAETEDWVTVEDRLQPGGESRWWEKAMYWWVSEAPGGRDFRSKVIDPVRLGGEHVVWRNYEASYDVAGLNPGSRDHSTYVLLEYFVPMDRFMDFAPAMAEIFERFDANVVNVSIRHANADPDTFLSWAPEACFAFVIYFKQGTEPSAQTEVGVWTRALNEAVLASGGTYYLPYQLHATQDQFHRAYPRAREFFQLKAELDPDYKFRNRLFDRHYPPSEARRAARQEAAIRAQLVRREGYQRPEDQTYLTLPEWYIVYSADELGRHLENGNPTAFPWFGSLSQFWTLYRHVSAATADRYPFNTGYHAMIGVIGASYSMEYGLKGLYESTVGRATLWWDGDTRGQSPEELLYREVARDYGAFLHHTPFYAFPFAEKRDAVWALPGGPWTVRRLERRVAIWTEFAMKGVWCGLMAWGTEAAYGEEATHIQAWVRADPAALDVEGVVLLETLGDGNLLIGVPRYEPFSSAVPLLVDRGVEFVEIAGNDRILMTLIAPSGWNDVGQWASVVHEWPLLTDPDHKRVAVDVAVDRLDDLRSKLSDVQIDHLYDY